jgi:hypothetical protein
MAGPRGNKKQAPFQPSGETTRVVSLGKGTWAYVFDAKGKTHHIKRDSEEMVSVCAENDETLGGKITRDLEKLGWTDIIEKMSGSAPVDTAGE